MTHLNDVVYYTIRHANIPKRINLQAHLKEAPHDSPSPTIPTRPVVHSSFVIYDTPNNALQRIDTLTEQSFAYGIFVSGKNLNVGTTTRVLSPRSNRSLFLSPENLGNSFSNTSSALVTESVFTAATFTTDLNLCFKCDHVHKKIKYHS